ncbi:DUF2254 domain-containing protein [uncultured Sphingomonas sp.]|uniref:DUF2254 domain-containing protein n=1 Tax=uncultured Sphingomonas sp. TaxID=158754 RepID=UPI0025F74DB9|nr:DUF2254 domain-containing protein [uncultured Sphingomonas sp.]
MSGARAKTRWQWVLSLLTRRMWFRAALFCLFGGALALAGALAGHTISYEFATKVGAKSVDNILSMLASSMLAVTTFSLTAMVSAFSGATSTITPRAVQLLVDDSTAQNALATFLGSFLFAIVGIIALSTGLYGETGRVILLAGTVMVIVFIVVTLLRWIEHIARFGRVADTIDRVERAATEALGTIACSLDVEAGEPSRPLRGGNDVRAITMGRVTHIDLSELGEIAAELDTNIDVHVLPGEWVDPEHALATLSSPVDERFTKRIRQAFTLAHHRAFDHDPRFGLVVLSEIASRALSPAVNDPGTAIAVIEAGGRVLLRLFDRSADAFTPVPDRVRMRALRLSDVLEDFCRPIARDGAGMIEVGVRLQKTLAALAAHTPAAAAIIACEADDALDRARAALTSPRDIALIERVRAEAFADGT